MASDRRAYPQSYRLAMVDLHIRSSKKQMRVCQIAWSTTVVSLAMPGQPGHDRPAQLAKNLPLWERDVSMTKPEPSYLANTQVVLKLYLCLFLVTGGLTR